MDRPLIAVLMGDPAGIGPELVVKMMADRTTYDLCRPFVVGALNVMEENCCRLGAKLRFVRIGDVGEARCAPGTVEVLTPTGLEVTAIPWGRVDATMGQAVALCLQCACGLATERQIDGIVAAPLNKQAFHMAGYDYLDEVPYLAELTQSPDAYLLGALVRCLRHAARPVWQAWWMPQPAGAEPAEVKP